MHLMAPVWLCSSGRMTLSYRMLLLDYDPVDVWGTLVLDLSLPWDRIIAASLYEKVRKRELLRRKLIAVYQSQHHHSVYDSHAEQDKLEYYSLIANPTFVRAEWRQVVAKLPDQTSRPVDTLPDWEAKCWLDDHEVKNV
jgi:hypothetical protein